MRRIRLSRQPEPRDPRAEARRNFPQFYLLASPEEEAVMDAFVLARAAVEIDIATSREELTPELRGRLEAAFAYSEGALHPSPWPPAPMPDLRESLR